MNLPYHIPDERWSILGSKNYDEFLSNTFVNPNFHKSVPNEIIDNYKTIEFIMAHSYYFYPMYDEAIATMLRVIEMAVKIKATQINVSHVLIDKNGNSRTKTLNQIIHEICDIEKNKNHIHLIDHLRELRNLIIHRSQNSYSGTIGKPIILKSIYAINLLFIPSNIIENNRKIKENITYQLNTFCNKPSILNYNNNNFLIHKVELKFCVNIQGIIKYLVVLSPIYLDIKKQIIEHKYQNPFIFRVENLVVNNESINFNVLYNSNNVIKLELTNNILDIEKYNNFCTDLNSCNKTEIYSYEFDLQHSINGEAINFIHDYFHLLN